MLKSELTTTKHRQDGRLDQTFLFHQSSVSCFAYNLFGRQMKIIKSYSTIT